MPEPARDRRTQQYQIASCSWHSHNPRFKRSKAVMGTAFPKSVRLLNANEYLPVLKHPEINLSAGPLRIRAIQNRMPTARLGQVVTKRGNSRAVRRNRIKRIIREEFRLHRSALPSLDIVVQVFGEIDDTRLRQRLQGQFKKLEHKLEQ